MQAVQAQCTILEEQLNNALTKLSSEEARCCNLDSEVGVSKEKIVTLESTLASRETELIAKV